MSLAEVLVDEFGNTDVARDIDTGAWVYDADDNQNRINLGRRIGLPDAHKRMFVDCSYEVGSNRHHHSGSCLVSTLIQNGVKSGTSTNTQNLVPLGTAYETDSLNSEAEECVVGIAFDRNARDRIRWCVQSTGTNFDTARFRVTLID